MKRIRYRRAVLAEMLRSKAFTRPQLDALPECQASIRRSLEVNEFAQEYGRPSRTPASYVLYDLRQQRGLLKWIGTGQYNAKIWRLTPMGIAVVESYLARGK